MMPSAGEIETQLRESYGDGAPHETRSVVEELAAHFHLTPQELTETDGSHPRFEHKVHTALTRHGKLALLVRPKRGWFRYIPQKLARYKPNHRPRRTPPTLPLPDARSNDEIEIFSFRMAADDVRMLKALAAYEGVSVGDLATRVLRQAVPSAAFAAFRQLIADRPIHAGAPRPTREELYERR